VSTLDEKRDEINELATELWEKNTLDVRYLELTSKLFEFFADWGSSKVVNYNGQSVECLYRTSKKGNTITIAEEVLYKIIKILVIRYDYNQNNNFMAYFFAALKKANQHYWSDLKNGIRVVDITIRYDDEDNDYQGGIDTIADPGETPEDYLTESHIIIQAGILNKPIADYAKSRGKKYYNLFFTQDVVSIVKSLISTTDIKKIEAGAEQVFRAMDRDFIRYLYESQCNRIYDLATKDFRKIDNSIDENGKPNYFIKFNRSQNKVKGIFIQRQEISKYLVVVDLMTCCCGDFIKILEQFIADMVKCNKHEGMIRSKDVILAHDRKEYNKLMKTLLPVYGSYVLK